MTKDLFVYFFSLINDDGSSLVMLCGSPSSVQYFRFEHIHSKFCSLILDTQSIKSYF